MLEPELLQALARCVHDPLRYVHLVYPWGRGDLEGKLPRAWQSELLDEIGQRLRRGESYEEPLRIALASGHGIGKSAFVAWLCMWSLDTCPGARVVVTANTADQLKGKTWAELQSWHRRSITASAWIPTATSLYSADPPHERTWRADAVPWSEHRTEAFAGLHNRGKSITLIMDEASAIAPPIWEVSEGAMTDTNTRKIWFAPGNPTRNEGRFLECFGARKHRWPIRKQIDSRTVEGVAREQLDQWVADYGEDSDFVRVRVRGVFPRLGTVQFMSTEDVAASMKRLPFSTAYDAVVMGVDVARFGDDESVITIRKGRDAKTVPQQRFRGLDAMQLVGHICKWIDACDGAVEAVFVDATGVGGPVADRLRQLGYRCVDVNNGAESDCMTTGEKCANKGAECWARMREWVRTGGVVADDRELELQLTNRQYGYDAHNRLLLEKKSDLKKRGLSSPDRADSLALTFAYPVASRVDQMHRSVHGGVTESEYDPYAPERL
jgi:hypothetical protein